MLQFMQSSAVDSKTYILQAQRLDDKCIVYSVMCLLEQAKQASPKISEDDCSRLSRTLKFTGSLPCHLYDVHPFKPNVPSSVCCSLKSDRGLLLQLRYFSQLCVAPLSLQQLRRVLSLCFWRTSGIYSISLATQAICLRSIKGPRCAATAKCLLSCSQFIAMLQLITCSCSPEGFDCLQVIYEAIIRSITVLSCACNEGKFKTNVVTLEERKTDCSTSLSIYGFSFSEDDSVRLLSLEQDRICYWSLPLPFAD